MIVGGAVAIGAATSLGNGATTNTVALANGGTLRYTGTAAFNLGVLRDVEVSAGGGTLSHAGTAAVTMTIPGRLTGSGDLKFTTTGTATAAATTTYLLSGENAGYNGNITVESTSNIVSTLSIANQAAVPNAASITVLHPAGSTTNATNNTLALANVALPAVTTVNLNGFNTGAITQRTQVTNTGNSTINGPITLNGNGGAVIQFVPTTGSLTFNGNISEATPGSFGTPGALGVLFFRSAGNTIINGTINAPNALVSRVDDNGTTTINSTGNVWAATDVRSTSTLRLGISNALPIGASLTIGQASDAGASVFEMNGFNQQVNGLSSINGNANNTRRVSNVSTTLSTLTLDGSIDRTFGNSTGIASGNITGNIAIVKNGVNTQTLAGPANTYTGNVTVNSGTLVAGGNATSNALGSPTTAGRVITVNDNGSLSLTTNNVFGNGINNLNLPSVIVTGGAVSSSRYNVLGNVALNGGDLVQDSSDAGGNEGYQFRGDITVAGSASSTISTSSGKANHLGANTIFNVADATGSSATDLLVSTGLRDQSGDFAQAAGGLTKTGAGTLELAGAGTYTGGTAVNAGTLSVSGSISGSIITVESAGTLGGTGIVGTVNVLGGAIAPGAGPGTLSTGMLTLDSNSDLHFELAQAGVEGGGINDLINVTGSFTLDGLLQITELPGFTEGTYRIASYSGGILTDNGLLLDPAFSLAHPGSFIDVANIGQVNLVVVPEPATATILLGGLAMLAGVRRRQRAN